MTEVRPCSDLHKISAKPANDLIDISMCKTVADLIADLKTAFNAVKRTKNNILISSKNNRYYFLPLST